MNNNHPRGESLSPHRLIRSIVAITTIFIGIAHAHETAIQFDATRRWSMAGGGSGVFGWQFTAQSNIWISALGIYDNPGIYEGGFPGDGLLEEHTVGIWDVSEPSVPLISSFIPSGTGVPLVNGFRYVDISPLKLLAGREYIIAATFQGHDFMTGSYNNPEFDLTVRPEISFGGYRSQVYSSNLLVFPETYNAGVEFAFGPNFTFTVQEPARTNMIYWQHDDGRVASWHFDGTNFQQATPLFKYFDSTSWRIVGVNDFNLDQEPDYLWQKSNESVLYARWTESEQMEKQHLRWRGPHPHSWRFAGFGDFNNDTHEDMLWQNTNGLLEVWFMNGLDILGYSTLLNGQTVNPSWRAMGIHDFNHDTHADVLWQRDDGQIAVRTMNQTNVVSAVAVREGNPAASGWRISGLSDFNKDGDKDILLRNKDGRLGVWVMDETAFVRAIPLRRGSPRSAGWRIVGVQ